MIAQVFAPWRTTRTFWSFVFCLLSLAVGSVYFAILSGMFAAALSSIVVFPVTVVIVWLVFYVVRVLGFIERSRFSALLGIDMRDPVPPKVKTNWWWRQLEMFTSLARWRELAYMLLLFPLGLLTYFTVLIAWVVGLVALTLPLYINALPGKAVTLFGYSATGYSGATFLIAFIGLIFTALIAPWLTVAMAGLTTSIGRWLISVGREEELENAVELLEVSRTAAVDSAEAERRRIERDLHDGAQQRLVAIAIDLGRAREKADITPEESHQVITKAHEETKAAMKDLRDLVRGIHPVVLEDRGLDPALSAIVARSAIPVALNISVRGRLSPAVESAAYFIVSESLTNVARHSQATSASVTVERRGDRLIIDVTDNGIGGVNQDAGTGIHGLKVRVTGLSGWMTVVSPVGGPTSIIAELPCA